MALILIGLIVLPSGLLGYLSWRAIERERSYSEERMRESYRRIARLAGLEIDRELHALEGRWAAELDAEAGAVDPSSASAAGGREPLVAARFVIAAPGRVVVPRVSLGRDVAGPGTDEEEIRADEHERFDRWITHGEELEYKARDFSGAIGWYRGAAARATSTRLKAMAQSYIGRVQLKSGDATAALATYGDLLAHYPEARDLNRMYLRFLAQYQRAVALEGLGRDREAVETLLELNQDLLRRSDAINQVQYAYYRDLIQDLMPRLLSSPTLTDPVTYEREFQRLRDQTKKRIGDRYLVQLLDGELSKMVLRRRHHATRLRYLSDRGQEDPFLIVYRTLPDAGGVFVRGLVAAQLDLTRLHQELLPTLAKGLGGDGASLAILGPGGEFVFGPSHLGGSPIATAALKGPFDFWQVGVFLADVPGAIRRLDLRSTLWLWLVCLLLATILFASSMFIGRARRQAYLARAQTTFVSNVTHELRTPLTSIKMLAELLEMEWTGPTADAPERRAAAAQYLAIIQRECDRLSRLIDRVLDFSRMEQRARTYRFETQELAPALAEVVESFRPHAEAEGFVLQLSIDADLPAVRLDADAFAQVMHNLLGNAVRYSENEREIRVRAYRSGHRVAVDVEDRGIGISKHELPRLFDRFFTGDPSSTARGQGGLGLGLTLSHGIVRAHGGEIKVASKVGRGSTFTVLLPPAPAGSVVAGNGERAEARREAGGAS
jgi:two-component system phosphate regulon sensor histidine kinase PhoR